MVGNSLWFQTFQDTIVEILPPNISEHAPIRVRNLSNQNGRKFLFKFLNCVTQRECYQDIVKDNWNQRIQGTPMQILWLKLKRLKHPIKSLQKYFTGIRVHI